MLDPLTSKAASLFKEHLTSACPDQGLEVRVYGSRARGEAREDSDLDILVLTRHNEEEVKARAWDAVMEVYRALDYPFPISAQVMSFSHFSELLQRERLFALSVMAEGRVI